MFELSLLLHFICKRPVKSSLCCAGVLASLWISTPVASLFPDDYSTLVFDADRKLLRATLASDEQYRFPPDTAALPTKYITALLAYEDSRFYSHAGVDPLALGQALLTNLRSGERVRGGSTITMQLARLSDPKSRTYWNKLIECMAALRLSRHYEKSEVLKLYASSVPMGGNIVGIPAASYVYLGKPVSELTWAEAALFAVLPNSPAMINLEKQRPRLTEKRNRLLKSLAKTGTIDEMTQRLACAEPLPDRQRRLPFAAPHFTQAVLAKRKAASVVNTTLDRRIQRKTDTVAKLHHARLADKGVNNLAVLVVESETARVRAYVGSHDFADQQNGGQVDGVRARRSTGSLLKPFLVAKALDRGPYTMAAKIQDVPSFYGTFAPQNAAKSYSGLASLEQVLVRSLNVPAVRLLNSYGVADFYDFLQGGKLNGLFRSPDGYGLTLILGGAEASLFELTQLYLALANGGRLRFLSILKGENDPELSLSAQNHMFSEGAAWLVLDTLRDLVRPGSDAYWQHFNNQIPVAWKTGTSYGQKDAWAIGVNRQWTIGVWAGNFDGEGNASLSGSRSAAPLLFDLFNTLTDLEAPMWFEEPGYDLKSTDVCTESGYPAGAYCPQTVTRQRPLESYLPGTCPFHRRYLIDRTTERSACSLCWGGLDTTWVSRYILPPSVAEVITQNGYVADIVPRHSSHCPIYRDETLVELIYPVDGIKIFVPRAFDGNYEKVVFSAKHQQPDMHLFWYLNGRLIRETQNKHQFSFELDPGEYKLTVQDETGVKESVRFSAFRKAMANRAGKESS